jgi:hypothetical protein
MDIPMTMGRSFGDRSSLDLIGEGARVFVLLNAVELGSLEI